MTAALIILGAGLALIVGAYTRKRSRQRRASHELAGVWESELDEFEADVARVLDEHAARADRDERRGRVPS